MTDVTAPLTTDRQAPVHPEWPRCDRCGGRGRIEATKLSHDGRILLMVLCAAHANVARSALHAAGWDVERIVEKITTDRD